MSAKHNTYTGQLKYKDSVGMGVLGGKGETDIVSLCVCVCVRVGVCTTMLMHRSEKKEDFQTE